MTTTKNVLWTIPIFDSSFNTCFSINCKIHFLPWRRFCNCCVWLLVWRQTSKYNEHTLWSELSLFVILVLTPKLTIKLLLPLPLPLELDKLSSSSLSVPFPPSTPVCLCLSHIHVWYIYVAYMHWIRAMVVWCDTRWHSTWPTPNWQTCKIKKIDKKDAKGFATNMKYTVCFYLKFTQ